MSKTVDAIHELGFTDEEITECLNKRGLLSIELEFTKKCNLRCLYCYSEAGEPAENELGIEELKSAILQAKELGAKKIILLGGGEPLLFHGLEDIVEFINYIGLQQILFTNGTLLTRKTAMFLYKNKVSVVIKHNSFKPEVQDMLTGVRGSFKNIKQGLSFLMEAGYPDRNVALGIQTVICRQNKDELTAMWVWARENRIIPYFEILTYQGRARKNNFLSVPMLEIQTIFEDLEVIDRERFGIIWHSHPTIAAFSCKRHLYSCLINSQGYIQPCTGVDMYVGNIREKSLSEILRNSEVIRNLRNIYGRIEGYCRTCEYHRECYGCRGNAYQITGNYLASDPTCWRSEKANNEGLADFC
ncbi:MAG: radical SAM protein [Nitrospirota bacterium]